MQDLKLRSSKMAPFLPCRYQVCLFCYGQVKEMCGPLCPGCRREYGEPVDAATVKAHAAEVGVSAGVRSFTAAVKAVPVQRGTAAPVQGAGGRAGATPAPIGTPPGSHGKAGMGRRGGGVADAVGVLPSGATWGVSRAGTAEDGTRPVSGGGLADESAWPSLPPPASSGTHANAKPAGQPHMEARSHELDRCQSLESAASGTSHMRSMSGSSAACIDTESSRCSTSPELDGEACQRMAMAMKAGKDAGIRLMSLLRQKGLGMAKAAPPSGFGAPQPLIDAQDPSLPSPPLGKYQPIQPPVSGDLRARQAQEDACAAHATTEPQRMPAAPQPEQGNTGYSMWSGLPGIDIGIAQAIWADAHVCVHTCQDRWASGGGCYPKPGMLLASKPVPPGFGHSKLMGGLVRPPPPGFGAFHATPLGA